MSLITTAAFSCDGLTTLFFDAMRVEQLRLTCRGSQGFRRHHRVPTVRQKLSFSLLAMASLTAPSVGRRRTIHKSQSGVRSAVRIRFP